MGSSAFVSLVGGAFVVALAAGYWSQKNLGPPPPKLLGIDLGTTYSCIGTYQSVSGDIIIFQDADNHKCIPSVVGFQEEIVVGHQALAQQEHNAMNTVYDAKRFIGKKFTQEELDKESERYQFKMVLDAESMVKFKVTFQGKPHLVSPEEVGGHIISTLRHTADLHVNTPKHVVMSVPAEFGELQRNYTVRAANSAGFKVARVINEPTAAALAYGLHKKKGISNVMVIDLGGGTLDVSLLAVQNGMFLTQAIAGNNHLGGQDFNNNMLLHLLAEIDSKYNGPLTDADDIQNLRDSIEQAKLQLTFNTSAIVNLAFHSYKHAHNRAVVYTRNISRSEFEDINQELFQKVLEPIHVVLKEADISPSGVDEIVLVGGSTRIPKVREIITAVFNKKLNTRVDADLAVVSGVSIQAGIIGGMWPLNVSAIELPTTVRKIHLN